MMISNGNDFLVMTDQGNV